MGRAALPPRWTRRRAHKATHHLPWHQPVPKPVYRLSDSISVWPRTIASSRSDRVTSSQRHASVLGTSRPVCPKWLRLGTYVLLVTRFAESCGSPPPRRRGAAERCWGAQRRRDEPVATIRASSLASGSCCPRSTARRKSRRAAFETSCASCSDASPSSGGYRRARPPPRRRTAPC